MPDHVHLIVFPAKSKHSVSLILKKIKEPVSKRAFRYLESNDPSWIERLTRKRGQRTERLFWQSGGGFDRNITERKTLDSMIDYIHLNPVRKGYVELARDWKWSSAAWFERFGAPLRVDPIPDDWLANCFWIGRMS
jgi:putative transposase